MARLHPSVARVIRLRVWIVLLAVWSLLPVPRAAADDDSSSPPLADSNSTNMAPTIRSHPLKVRVGLLENYEKLTFQMHGLYRIEHLDGTALRQSGQSPIRWRARIDEAVSAQFLFSVLVASYQTQTEAMQLAESFEQRGIPAAVRQVGGAIEFDQNVAGDNTLYRVQAGNFKIESDAQHLLDSLTDEFAPRIVREEFRRSRGRIEFFDSDLNETYAVDEGFRLIPLDNSAYVTIFGVLTGTGFKWEKTENRNYAGNLEVYLDHQGQIAALNEIPMDVYLHGVVPAEMPAGFPREALMAQAIVSRSVVMAQKSIKHLNDPFELCAHVHCQVYSGLTHEDERTNEAVDETKGVVLTKHGELVDTHYSAVCGGHTEDANLTWMTPSMCNTEGLYCGPPGVALPDLTTEAGARAWIFSEPDVYCNLTGTDIPVSSDYGRRHFRWEVSYSRPELERIIREKTGEDIGTLYDIVPLQRGHSGRLIEIEILGSRKNLHLKRELKIRRALSDSALESSCFVVEVIHDSLGVPVEIVFHGAGWGHGVGLCQCGAARMAKTGMSHEQIFNHYFPGLQLKKLY
ncbi:SpoIID/LytB domain-containing protein [candidate division KSB1 bacterium]|nr:SpoIID/LytB domain-containing protein [candidate division KSB1 bacterium]